jgi:hypothetical protein
MVRHHHQNKVLSVFPVGLTAIFFIMVRIDVANARSAGVPPIVISGPTVYRTLNLPNSDQGTAPLIDHGHAYMEKAVSVN